MLVWPDHFTSLKTNLMKWIFSLAAVCFMSLQAVQAQDMPQIDKSPMDAAYFPNRAAFRAFEDSEAKQEALKPVIRVLYSRPQKKDRNVFGELVAYDKVWRTGANEATEITFYEDVVLGDTKINAGRYTLYTKPGEEEWEVMINTDLDTWGAYAYKPEHTIATTTVPVQETPSTVEAFTILFEEVNDGAHMIIAWDDTMVRVPFKTWSM